MKQWKIGIVEFGGQGFIIPIIPPFHYSNLPLRLDHALFSKRRNRTRIVAERF